MKKYLCVVLTIAICISLACFTSSCSKGTEVKSTTLQSASTEITESILSTDAFSTQNTTEQKNDIGDGIITVQKYRCRFYDIPAPFAYLVGKETCLEWEGTLESSSETMKMSQFVQHFGITREQFDKANLAWAKIVAGPLAGVPCLNPKDYANQEDDEIFNADIIYTFDDDVIREYYLSPDYPYLYDIEAEEAVKAGEYTMQTEEWIDVAAMEAEIIAKYGDAA